MPCYDDREPTYREEIKLARLEFEFANLQKRNDKLARLLCEICNKIEDSAVDVKFSNELAQWWEEHKELDRARGFRI